MPAKLAALTLLLALALPVTPARGGAKDPAEEVVALMLGQLEKMAETLASMKDEESSAKGRESLKDYLRGYKDLREKAEKLPPPTREVKERLEKEYKKKFVDVQEKLMNRVALVRATVPGGREALTEVIPFLLSKEMSKEMKGKSVEEKKKTDKEKEPPK
jgi:hypothetical protein